VEKLFCKAGALKDEAQTAFGLSETRSEFTLAKQIPNQHVAFKHGYQ